MQMNDDNAASLSEMSVYHVMIGQDRITAAGQSQVRSQNRENP